MLPFDVAQIDAWLPTVDFRRLSAASLRALAVEKFGQPEKSSKQYDRRSVHIPEALWARIKPFALSQKACALVELILEEWLAKPADAQAIVLASDKLRRAQKKERAQERDKEAKTPRGGATRRAEQKADDVVARPKTSDAAETPRLSYEQRRKQQIAAGGTPIPVKDRKYKSKTKIVFTECHGNSFVESNEGQMRRFSNAANADRYYDELAAEDAALEYSADRGYTVFPRQCANCSTSAKPIWHVFRERKSAQWEMKLAFREGLVSSPVVESCSCG